MFDFYGGSLEITYDDRLDSPGFNYRNNEEHLDRIYNINNKLHNCLRITRILTYLDLMEMFSLRDMFLNYLIESIFFDDAIGSCFLTSWLHEGRGLYGPRLSV